MFSQPFRDSIASFMPFFYGTLFLIIMLVFALDAIYKPSPKVKTADATGEIDPKRDPAVPAAIIEAIAAYGDARADNDLHLGAERLATCISLIRSSLSRSRGEAG